MKETRTSAEYFANSYSCNRWPSSSSVGRSVGRYDKGREDSSDEGPSKEGVAGDGYRRKRIMRKRDAMHLLCGVDRVHRLRSEDT